MTTRTASAPSRACRAWRGFLAAALAVHVAAFFHVAGGGTPPAPVTVALTLAFAAPLSVALPGRRMGLARVTATVALSQFLFHVLFALSPAGPSASIHGAHAHGEVLELPALDPVVLPMWQAHALAVIVTTAALVAGSRVFTALEALGRLAVRRLLAPLAPVEPLAVPGSHIPDASGRPLHERLAWVPSLRHRGPPARAARSV